MGSPPHTRGILCKCDCGNYKSGITPAHAGNTTRHQKMVADQWDHPRTRGEYISDQGRAITLEGSPPHTRGIHRVRFFCCQPDGITPAHAGNTNSRTTPLWRPRDHPRTRGEYESRNTLTMLRRGSPPHTRGIQLDSLEAAQKDGITPAHAGNTPYSIYLHLPAQDHPRTRGEYGLPPVGTPEHKGSPPHTRGILDS